jgi:hypothetical protein
METQGTEIADQPVSRYDIQLGAALVGNELALDREPSKVALWVLDGRTSFGLNRCWRKIVFTAMHQRLEQPLLLDGERPICGP